MKLKSIYLKEIVAAMCEHNPAKTPAKKAKYEAIATDWIDNCRNFTFMNSHYDEDNLLYLPLKKVQDNFNYRYKVNGKPHYWYNWFVANYPLWKVLQKGYNYKNNAKASQIQLLDPFTHKNTTIDQRIEMIKNIGQSGYYEQNLAKINKQVAQKEGREIIHQKIDVDNLHVYIMDTEYRLEDDTLSDKYRQTLKFNLEKAYKIIAVLEPDQPYIPVLTTKHSFGRVFHGGINIQGAHSELRKAALGSCDSIDLEASVFGYYHQQLVQSNADQKYIDLLQIMMDDRTKFRQTIVNDCFSHLTISNSEKIKMVKSCLTALGFGAKKDNFRYFNNNNEIEWKDAIPNYILDDTARNKFINHKAVKLLGEAVEIIIQGVRDLYKNEKQFKDIVDAVPEIANSKRMNYKQVLAFMYQTYEKKLRNKMIKVIEEKHHGEVLLQTHDGIFVKQAFPYEVDDINQEIQTINPVAKVDLESIGPYANRRVLNAKKEAVKESLSYEELHKQFIAEQEKLAKNYHI